MGNAIIIEDLLQKLADFDLKDEVFPESSIMTAMGGFADVFTGSLACSDTRVAIKRIRASMGNDSDFVKVCRLSCN